MLFFVFLLGCSVFGRAENNIMETQYQSETSEQAGSGEDVSENDEPNEDTEEPKDDLLEQEEIPVSLDDVGQAVEEEGLIQEQDDPAREEGENDQSAEIQESGESQTVQPGESPGNGDEIDISAPDIYLKISEGPLYTEDGSICYYRIKAFVTGEPLPEISFSKDDSNGAWGSDTAQVNLFSGETYELKAIANNAAGTAESVIVLDFVEKQKDMKEQSQASIVDVDYQDIGSLLIDVDLSDQYVTVFYKGQEVKKMTCSAGTPSDPTPLGTFNTSQKIYYAWLPKYDVGVFYIVRFIGPYLFHSVPFDRQGNMIIEEYEKLGTPASHGCIRLALEDAKWFYDTLPLGVGVTIHD